MSNLPIARRGYLPPVPRRYWLVTGTSAAEVERMGFHAVDTLSGTLVEQPQHIPHDFSRVLGIWGRSFGPAPGPACGCGPVMHRWSCKYSGGVS